MGVNQIAKGAKMGIKKTITFKSEAEYEYIKYVMEQTRFMALTWKRGGDYGTICSPDVQVFESFFAEPAPKRAPVAESKTGDGGTWNAPKPIAPAEVPPLFTKFYATGKYTVGQCIEANKRFRAALDNSETTGVSPSIQDVLDRVVEEGVE